MRAPKLVVVDLAAVAHLLGASAHRARRRLHQLEHAPQFEQALALLAVERHAAAMGALHTLGTCTVKRRLLHR
eukprot:6181699-Pleurochrysis_carterae.AAC.1